MSCRLLLSAPCHICMVNLHFSRDFLTRPKFPISAKQRRLSHVPVTPSRFRKRRFFSSSRTHGNKKFSFPRVRRENPRLRKIKNFCFSAFEVWSVDCGKAEKMTLRALGMRLTLCAEIPRTKIFRRRRRGNISGQQYERRGGISVR